MCISIFTHISVHVLPFWLTRRDTGAVLDLDRGRSPRTCHDDQWLVRSSGGELGGKDLAAPCSSVAPTLASHPPWMLLLGYASTNRKCAVDSPLLTSYDVIIADNMPCILYQHSYICWHIIVKNCYWDFKVVSQHTATCWHFGIVTIVLWEKSAISIRFRPESATFSWGTQLWSIYDSHEPTEYPQCQ